MNNILNTQKNEFLINELMQASIQAGFATRNPEYPIYNHDNMGLNDARKLKIDLKKELMDYYNEIKEKNISEKLHIEKLVSINSFLTKKHQEILFNKSFRIGVTQKVVNLFLKCLWTTNICSMPSHCPIDNIVKNKIQVKCDFVLTDWTAMKTLEDYMLYVKSIKRIANLENLSIAEWELKIWKRRN